MKNFQDISLKEVGFKTQYYEDFTNGNIDKAKEVIRNNNLSDKVLQAEDLNMFSNNILSLEKKYLNFIQSLNDKQKEYQIKINDFLYLGEFNKNRQYEINNFIKYNKEIYFCHKKPPIGTVPTNDNYWTFLGLKGEVGSKSLGVKYQGEWNKTTSYSKFDMVNYQNNLFVCKINNSNKQPNLNLNEWSLQMQVSNSKILVQDTEPQNINNNEIWFQIL